jgi:glycosyltransferase involved in cell wall biosynthesis
MNFNTQTREPIFYVLTICWNESLFLKHFLDYYSFATKIIVFDNMSSDNSVEIMKQYNNVEICYYNTNEQIRDDIYLEIKNHAWKQYKNECDWVIIVDIDELIYHPLGIPQYVKTLQPNVAVVQCVGYEMFCPDIVNTPGNTVFEKSIVGVPGVKLDKSALINPKLVSEINYLGGCHAAFPKASGITHRDSQFKLLHYKFVYPIQYMIYRYKQMCRRLSKQNIDNGWGCHYMNINNLIKKYNDIGRNAHPVITPQ